METTKKSVKPYPAELRERAVRMVREHASEHASEGGDAIDRGEGWLYARDAAAVGAPGGA